MRSACVMTLVRAQCTQPQDAYGLEKLASEEICMHYEKDFGIAVRIARFHNIYGAPLRGHCKVS
jgi:nucleoside-diphosphate-sugar epimerase